MEEPNGPIKASTSERCSEIDTFLEDSNEPDDTPATKQTDNLTLVERLRKDKNYRHRFIHSACVFCSQFAVGWRNGIEGPTFPDLSLIIDEELSIASWIFTAIYVGGLIGSLCCGAIYDRFNKFALFVILTFGFAVLTAIAPWCANFPAMVLVHFFHGAFGVAICTVATADTLFVWKQESGSFMQAVHLGFSLGSVVGPLVSYPFLAPRYFEERTSDAFNKTDTLMSISNYTLSNMTEYTYGETKIHITYFITSAMCLLVTCLFVVQYCVLGDMYKIAVDPQIQKSRMDTQNRHLNKWIKIILIMLLTLVLMMLIITDKSLFGYLMTFIVSGLGWSKARGTSISATFVISFATGRLLAIGITSLLKTEVVLITAIGIMFAGNVIFLIAVEFEIAALVWIAVAAMGFGMSPIYASIFTWLSEHVVTLTGKLTSLLYVFAFIGIILFPILVGNLMANVSFMWYIYLHFIWIIAMAGLFVIAKLVYRVYSKR